MQLRMEKALKLIDKGTMKITDIAISLGYEDLSHFTKTFKKYTGVSPSKYISTLELD
jgi:two-component system, response regulator YesN